jgi:hypothetical protein
MIPEELGLPGSDELQRAKREAEQFDRLQKLDRDLTRFGNGSRFSLARPRVRLRWRCRPLSPRTLAATKPRMNS